MKQDGQLFLLHRETPPPLLRYELECTMRNDVKLFFFLPAGSDCHFDDLEDYALHTEAVQHSKDVYRDGETAEYHCQGGYFSSAAGNTTRTATCRNDQWDRTGQSPLDCRRKWRGWGSACSTDVTYPVVIEDVLLAEPVGSYENGGKKPRVSTEGQKWKGYAAWFWQSGVCTVARYISKASRVTLRTPQGIEGATSLNDVCRLNG